MTDYKHVKPRTVTKQKVSYRRTGKHPVREFGPLNQCEHKRAFTVSAHWQCPDCDLAWDVFAQM